MINSYPLSTVWLSSSAAIAVGLSGHNAVLAVFLLIPIPVTVFFIVLTKRVQTLGQQNQALLKKVVRLLEAAGITDEED